MKLGSLSREGIDNLIKWTDEGRPVPKIIADHKRKLEAAQRLAAFRFACTGRIDLAKVSAIVEMKLQLDDLYGAWAEERLEDTRPDIVIAH